MGVWNAVVIGLYGLGWVLPGVGAVLAYLRGKKTLDRRRWVVKRTAEIQAEWTSARETFSPSGASIDERNAEERAFNDEWHERFRAEKLEVPSAGNLDGIGNRTTVRVLELIFEGNAVNLALVLSGPLLSTVASIVALFPPA